MNAYRFAWYQLRLCFLLVLLLLSTNIASASTETGRPVNSGDEPPDSSYLYGEGAQFHKGLDWNQNFTYGDTVIATAPGVVVDLVETHQDGCHPGGSGLTFCNAYGNYVLIRHNAQHFDAVSSTTNGYVYSLYLHLRQNQVNVNVTNSVVAGTDIADGDDTGNSTGHHLHYQVIVHDLSNRVLSNIDSENRTRNPELWMASLTNTARLVGRVSNNSGDPISSLTVSGTALQKTGWSGGYLQTL